MAATGKPARQGSAAARAGREALQHRRSDGQHGRRGHQIIASGKKQSGSESELSEAAAKMYQLLKRMVTSWNQGRNASTVTLGMCCEEIAMNL